MGLFSPHGEPQAGSLLVASIASEMTRSRRSSNSQASSSSLAPCRVFEGRAYALPLAWAHQSSPVLNLLDDGASFRVAPRRHQQLPRQVQHFLQHLPSAQAEAAVRALQSHVLARLGFLVRAQHAVRQQLERTSQWRRNHWRPFRRLRGGGAGGAGGGEEHGRGSARRRGGQAARWAEQAEAFERLMDHEEAIAFYEKAAQAEPSSAEYWARLSKALSDSSYAKGTPPDRAKELNRRATELGLKAVEVDPTSAFGHVACCVSRGRLALYVDNRSKVALARQAQDDVRAALQLEPDNDVAHHLLGRWNYEMASVNGMVRTIIQMFYGTALMAGSYREAELCFQAAVRLRPDYLIHRVELGRTYVKLGRVPEAVQELEAAVALDVPDINAVLQKGDAMAMLAKLKGNSR